MHGDFSRWTFDPAAGYRAVLLQQGRVLLDADFNEQTAITAYHDETRTLDLLGPAGGPADGAGFALVDAAGAAPAGTAWEDLRVTPGRFYVDGVLAEAEAVDGSARPSARGSAVPGRDRGAARPAESRRTTAATPPSSTSGPTT